MITTTPKKDKSIYGRHTKPAPKQRLRFFGAGRNTVHNTPRNASRAPAASPNPWNNP